MNVFDEGWPTLFTQWYWYDETSWPHYLCNFLVNAKFVLTKWSPHLMIDKWMLFWTLSCTPTSFINQVFYENMTSTPNIAILRKSRCFYQKFETVVACWQRENADSFQTPGQSYLCFTLVHQVKILNENMLFRCFSTEQSSLIWNTCQRYDSIKFVNYYISSRSWCKCRSWNSSRRCDNHHLCKKTT